MTHVISIQLAERKRDYFESKCAYNFKLPYDSAIVDCFP